MPLFTVRSLKQRYIHGEVEPFCEIIRIDVDEFEQAEGYEEYYLTESEIKELKEKGVFKEWA